MFMRVFLSLLLVIVSTQLSLAQPDRWQQRIKYTMDINMDVQSNRFTGKQKIIFAPKYISG